MLTTFFKDKHGKWAVIDWPNIPLSIWIATLLVGRFLADGKIKDGFSALGTAALLTWAYLEISDGKSWFRRILGAVVAVFIIIGLFTK